MSPFGYVAEQASLTISEARSKQRNVTFSAARRPLSWVQAETDAQYGRVEHKRCFTRFADPAQAEQAIHMYDLDRAGTKGGTSPAVKDSRQSDGDEPGNDEQTTWMRRLVCVFGYQATDRPDVQLRDITPATCGTLARARLAVQYFVRKTASRVVIPSGDTSWN